MDLLFRKTFLNATILLTFIMAITAWLQQNALASITLISILLSLFVTLAYKYMTDQVLMKEYKAQLKKYQDEMKACKDDVAKVQELSSKAMEANMKYMKQTFKPMLITMVPFLIIFWGLKRVYDTLTIIPLPFHVPLSGLETGLGWIGTYILLSLILTSAFRKALKVT